MDRIHKLLVFTFLFFASVISNAQEIISVVPNSGYRGQTVSVIIRGTQTQFTPGVTVADFGAGITVENFFVEDPFTGTAVVKIEQTAALGSHDINIITGNEAVQLEDGFEVFESGSSVMAFLEIVPVQVLYISDFDPDNAANTPLLFTVTLVNDASVRDLIINFSVSGDQYGLLGTATKTLNAVAANDVVKTTNRDFDEYSVSDMGTELLDLVRATGMAPPDVYTYLITITDIDGNVLASDEGINIITNPVSDLELISPGVSLDEQPLVVAEPQPLFQWFSGASKFNVSLFEVEAGQNNPQDITEGVPVFQQTDVTAQTMLYPNYAENMVEGKTYAWLVEAHIAGSGGDWLMPSNLYWFTYSKANIATMNIDRIEIFPDDKTTGTGYHVQYRATVFDENDQPVQIRPEWKVVPADAGTIDENGLFAAGNRPKTAAIVASVGQTSEYVTLLIKWSPDGVGMNKFLRTVLGVDQPATIEKSGRQ
jgi:hypothetical protein